jgi:hypothetical protein
MVLKVRRLLIVGAASSRDLHHRDKTDSRLEAAPTMKLASEDSQVETYASSRE